MNDFIDLLITAMLRGLVIAGMLGIVKLFWKQFRLPSWGYLLLLVAMVAPVTILPDGWFRSFGLAKFRETIVFQDTAVAVDTITNQLVATTPEEMDANLPNASDFRISLSVPMNYGAWIAFGIILFCVAEGLRRLAGFILWQKRLRNCTRVKDTRLLKIFQESAVLSDMDTATIPFLDGSLYCDSPACIGLFRPAILFPVDLARQLPDASVRMLIVHELQHLKVRDPFYGTLLYFCCISFWINYFFRYIYRFFSEAREIECDRRVAELMKMDERQRVEYAKLLLAFHAEIKGRNALLFLGLSSRAEQLKRRILEITDPVGHAVQTLSMLCILGTILYFAMLTPIFAGGKVATIRPTANLAEVMKIPLPAATFSEETLAKIHGLEERVANFDLSFLKEYPGRESYAVRNHYMAFTSKMRSDKDMATEDKIVWVWWFTQHSMDYDVDLISIKYSAREDWEALAKEDEFAMQTILYYRDQQAQFLSSCEWDQYRYGNCEDRAFMWQYYSDIADIDQTFGDCQIAIAVYRRIALRYPKYALDVSWYATEILIDNNELALAKASGMAPAEYWKQQYNYYGYQHSRDTEKWQKTVERATRYAMFCNDNETLEKINKAIAERQEATKEPVATSQSGLLPL